MKMTMRLFAPTLLVSAALLLGAAPAGAADKAPPTAKPAPAKTAEKQAEKPAAPAAKPGPGEVTLSGDMTCAKCGLHESNKCQDVLKVKEAGKEVKYYLIANEVAEEHHEEVCGGSAPATVTGKVSEEAGKKMLKASSIKFN